MMTEEMPPDLDEQPDLDEPPIERTSTVPLPEEVPYQYGSGASYSGYNEDFTDPYHDLGGLTRPDAYFGAIDFDCPTCEAKKRTLEFDGEKCRVWVERIDKWVVRKMPCLARIRLAREAGIL